VILSRLFAVNPALPAVTTQPPEAVASADGVRATRSADQSVLVALAGGSEAPRTPLSAAIGCGELVARDFSGLRDASLRVSSATDVEASGSDLAYCREEGTVALNARFVLQLPRSGRTGT
jgi:hypothetical protein